MKISGHSNDEAGIAGGVRAAYRRFLREARRFAWRLLWVGNGLCLEAAACAERFFVDLVEDLERKSSRLERTCSRSWYSRIIGGVWGRLIRVARRCEPGVSAWRRLAMRIDVTLIERCRLTGCRDVSASG